MKGVFVLWSSAQRAIVCAVTCMLGSTQIWPMQCRCMSCCPAHCSLFRL